MAATTRVKLARLLRSGSSSATAVTQLLAAFGPELEVTDEAGNHLLGAQPSKAGVRHPVRHADGAEVAGWIVGGGLQAEAVAKLLEVWLAEEARRKALASEALSAYREITLLYKLAEQLGGSLKSDHLLSIALAEAGRVIPHGWGVIVLKEREDQRQPRVLSFGAHDLTTADESLASRVWELVVARPKPEIVNDLDHDDRFGSLGDLPVRALLWAPLPTRQRTLGVLALGRSDGKEYTAAELSLLRSIASQTAPAVDNAILYEDLERLVQRRTEELRLAKDQAEDANRQKTRFLATMSHELRTPLNALLGFSQILRRDGDLNAKQERSLDIVQRSGEQLLTLIEDLLDLSKIEAGRVEFERVEFSLEELLNHLGEIFEQRAHERGVEFVLERGGTLPSMVQGDQRKLRQVLTNLLGNAMKYTDHGRVTLRASWHDDRAHLEVEDTGIGVSSEDQSAIFEAFHQVQHSNRVNPGTGLGLAISRHLVSVMGGALTLVSHAGKGSTFAFDVALPALAGTAPTVGRAHDVVGYDGQRKRVLVVDDDATNRNFIVQLLGPLGFEMHEAVDGRRGVEMSLELVPDLVLMDVVMPMMSGYEAITEMRKSSALDDTRVIVLSASVFPVDRDQAREVGGDDFVAKPIRSESLLERIALHLGIRWRWRGGDAPLRASEGGGGTPPVELLRPLFEAARRGRVAGVRRAVDAIAATDGGYGAFLEPYRSWVKAFELDRIAAKLEPLLS